MLSVIVPTCNSESTVGRCLEAIKKSVGCDYRLIVVDDASSDFTPKIAEKYADRMIVHPHNMGRSLARNHGIEAAQSEIVVLIDSDVLVSENTLCLIADYFAHHRDVTAITGLLSTEHPNRDFFSQYKNLYMNYIFSKLPKQVTFLYGSIHALRKSEFPGYGDVAIADDTALGQKLVEQGKRIVFLKKLEVIHLKKYNFFSLMYNDFRIPFDWAVIFIKYQGWKQLGKNETGYAHSPKEQLACVMLAPVIFALISFFALTGAIPLLFWLTMLLSIWGMLNYRFISFLARHKGAWFCIVAFLFTFLDNLIMAAGIACGFATYPALKTNRSID